MKKIAPFALISYFALYGLVHSFVPTKDVEVEFYMEKNEATRNIDLVLKVEGGGGEGPGIP